MQQDEMKRDFSFYNETYTIAGTKYVNPIAKNALKHYDYQILDTVMNSNGKSYMIHFKPIKKAKRENNSKLSTAAIYIYAGALSILCRFLRDKNLQLVGGFCCCR